MKLTTKQLVLIGVIVLLAIGLFTGQFGAVADLVRDIFGVGPENIIEEVIEESPLDELEEQPPVEVEEPVATPE